MVPIWRAPKWIEKYRFDYQNYDDVPQEVFDSINGRLDRHLSDTPEVSILIAAWNEEINILRTIASLADQKTNVPFEIVVVNNNSTDHTQDVLNRLHVPSFFQPIQGWGPARQKGLENALGQYVLIADADCIYPKDWLEELLSHLKRDGVVCVYGRYSFIPVPGYARWQLFLLEKLKDLIAEFRHFKRPYLNAYGISMGYLREPALKIGYVMHKIRGEDGRLCFDLMQYGSVRQVKSSKARVWTAPRTVQRDGSFSRALLIRIRKELGRFTSLFRPMEPHDTKTSKNE